MTYIVLPIIDLDKSGNRVTAFGAKFLPEYYSKMGDQGLLEHAFYDGSAKTYAEFGGLVSHISVVFLFIFKEDEVEFPVAHCHITNMQGYNAYIHFNILREYQKDHKNIMADTLESIFTVTRPDKTPFVTSLLGVTPVYNTAALNAIKEVGFERLALLDRACYLYYRKKYVGGQLSLLTADMFNKRIR